MILRAAHRCVLSAFVAAALAGPVAGYAAVADAGRPTANVSLPASGEELVPFLRNCIADDDAARPCLAFASAAVGAGMTVALMTQTTSLVCPGPAFSDPKIVYQAVVGVLEEDSRLRDLSAGGAFFLALQKRFPCPSPSSQKEDLRP